MESKKYIGQFLIVIDGVQKAYPFEYSRKIIDTSGDLDISEIEDYKMTRYDITTFDKKLIGEKVPANVQEEYTKFVTVGKEVSCDGWDNGNDFFPFFVTAGKNKLKPRLLLATNGINKSVSVNYLDGNISLKK